MREYYIRHANLLTYIRTLVLDKENNNVFLLAGRRGKLGDEMCLYDMTGKNLAKMKQVSVVFGNRFELFLENEKIATLTKFFKVPKNYYFVKDLSWQVIGDIVHHEYSIHKLRKHEQIMRMSNATTISGEMYCMEITNEEDAPLCILIATILDYWNYGGKTQKKEGVRRIVESV